MRIVITEGQYSKLVEQVVVKCVPTGETEFNKIDISFYDMLYNGSILNYGDYDVDKTHLRNPKKNRDRNRWVLWKRHVKSTIQST